MRYLLAHDIGTSGDKATLFSEDGKRISSALSEYPLIQEGDIAEQDARDWWRAFCSSTRKLLRESGVDPSQIAAVSFSGQMMGALAVDGQGEALRNSLIWADQRAQKEVEEIRSRLSDQDFYQIAGHRNSPSYGIQKVLWIKRNEPEIYEKARAFLNAKDFLVMKLTGRFATDPSDANGMDAIDIRTLRWSEKILDAAEVSADKLPEIIPSASVVGTILPEAAEASGLSPDTLVVMGAGDGIAANIGAGSVSPGTGYLCLGTSAWASCTKEAPYFDPDQRSVTWAHAVPGCYAPNATMQYCCGAYDWFRTVMTQEETRAARETGRSVHKILSEEAALSAPGSAGVIFMPQLLGERAPYWNPNVRGAFLGLSGTTAREDLVRAVFEGLSCHLSLLVDLVNSDSSLSEITLIGGGAENDFWAQMISDMLGLPVVIPEETREANSMGAAVIAGVGAGLFPDFSGITRFLHEKKRFFPHSGLHEFYRDKIIRYQECFRALEQLSRKTK